MPSWSSKIGIHTVLQEHMRLYHKVMSFMLSFKFSGFYISALIGRIGHGAVNMNRMHYGVKVPKQEETNPKEDLLLIIKEFEHEEVDELLSQTFCSHCERLLHDHVSSVANRKHINYMSSSSVETT